MFRYNPVTRLVTAFVALFLLLPTAALAQQGPSEYIFRADDGIVSIEDAHIGLWADGGDYVVKLTITPTQDEIDRLLTYGSHVDFEVSFYGLEPTSWQPELALSGSDYVRYVGPEVSPGANPLFKARGFNIIPDRWEANRPIVITASIYGYQPIPGAWVGVSVDMVSTYYSFTQDNECTFVYERTTNGETLEYCRGSDKQRSTLVDNREGRNSSTFFAF